MRIRSFNVGLYGLRRTLIREEESNKTNTTSNNGKDASNNRGNGESKKQPGVRKGRTALGAYLERTAVDVLCLQEIKLTRAEIDSTLTDIDGYTAYYAFASSGGPQGNGKGYSGTVIYCRAPEYTPYHAWTSLLCHDWTSDIYEGIFTSSEVMDIDREGRLIAIDLGQAIVMNVYIPARRRGFKRRYCLALQLRINSLRERNRHVILVGDMNISHRSVDHCAPIVDLECRSIERFGDDVHRQWLSRFLNQPMHAAEETKPLSIASTDGTDSVNRTSASSDGVGSRRGVDGGDTSEVRVEGQEGDGDRSDSDSESELDLPEVESDMVDLFRHYFPERPKSYTCWNAYTFARERNEGTRIDYIFCDRAFMESGLTASCHILSRVQGSDHCPVEAEVSIQPRDPSKGPIVVPRQAAQFLPEVKGNQTSLKRFLSTSAPLVQSEVKVVSDAPRSPQLSSNKKTRTAGPKSQSIARFFTQPKASSNGASKKSGVSNTPTTTVTSDPIETDDHPRPMSPSRIAAMQVVQQADKERARKAAKQWGKLFVPPPLCQGHKAPCIVRVVKKDGPTRGKKFYVCPRPNGATSCEHFEWLNKPPESS